MNFKFVAAMAKQMLKDFKFHGHDFDAPQSRIRAVRPAILFGTLVLFVGGMAPADPYWNSYTEQLEAWKW
jgi:hypothetical protein